MKKKSGSRLPLEAFVELSVGVREDALGQSGNVYSSITFSRDPKVVKSEERKLLEEQLKEAVVVVCSASVVGVVVLDSLRVREADSCTNS